MQDFRDQVAVVTGAASGIGAALATALAKEGARLVLADVASLNRTGAEVRAAGADALCLATDVADRAAVDRLADAAYARYGRVNLLCNNAGVVVFGSLVDTPEREWDWILGVNVRGVVNGISAFLPRMLRQDDTRHVLNTASGAGLLAAGVLPLGAYTTSKFAVVGLSEALRLELEPAGIGVTILCPGSVQTGILETAHYAPASEHLRPEAAGAPTPSREGIRRMQPGDVARLALAGIRANAPYVLTHPESRPALELRCRQLLEAADAASRALGLEV